MRDQQIQTSGSRASNAVDWQQWLQRWDVQQTGYLPDREARFDAMLDVLEILLPEEFVALDLACGPGAISQRLLARFPKARCVAVDLDPVAPDHGTDRAGNSERAAALGRGESHDPRVDDATWRAAV